MKLFISYSRDDKAWVYELWRALRDEAYHDAWIDRRLVPASDWWGSILDNIESCEVVIFVMTPKSIESIFCQAEWNYALALNKPIVPLMLKPSSYPQELSNKRIQYQVITDEMSMDKVLFQVTMGLMQVNQDIANGKYKPTAGTRPDVPEVEENPEHIFEVFALAEEAALERNDSLAEKLFQQVIKADPEGMGMAASQRLGEIRFERDRALAYNQVLRLASSPSTIRGAQATWEAFQKKYGKDYDPQNIELTLFGKVQAAPIQAPVQNTPGESVSQPPLNPSTWDTVSAIEQLLSAINKENWDDAEVWLAEVKKRQDIPGFFKIANYEAAISTALAKRDTQKNAEREYSLLKLLAKHDPANFCGSLKEFLSQYGQYDPDNLSDQCDELRRDLTVKILNHGYDINETMKLLSNYTGIAANTLLNSANFPFSIQNLSLPGSQEFVKNFEPLGVRIEVFRNDDLLYSTPENNSVSVILKEVGPNKINVIKVVRALGNLGLKEAKDAVEAAPILLAVKVPEPIARQFKTQLESMGAIVEFSAKEEFYNQANPPWELSYHIAVENLGSRPQEIVEFLKRETQLDQATVLQMLGTSPTQILVSDNFEYLSNIYTKLKALGLVGEIKWT